MTEKIVIERSLMEQIVEETLSKLAGEEGFDDALIERLEHLAKDGSLTSVSKLTAVIKSIPGERDEATQA